MLTQLVIKSMDPSQYPSCAQIYQEGLDTGIATFETVVPTWEQWDQKFLKECRLVAEYQNKVAAWGALSPFSDRAVYHGVGEVSIYVSKKVRGMGIGQQLLDALIISSEQHGFWTLQAKIFPQNKISLHLHQKAGFQIVGTRVKLAQRDGLWYDNVLLERRAEPIN